LKVFALLDGNSFYAKCEEIFQPSLKGTPVIVLSNNDGCVIARNAQAKALGVAMGAPYFQIRDFIAQEGINAFSSNYGLYADVSRRMMQTIQSQVPDIEVYSIDECWADLEGVPGSLEALGTAIQTKVKRDVGMPIGIGISTTKTLAKLAQWASKTWTATHGVVDLTSKARQEKLLRIAPVGQVWGIGRKLADRLIALNIDTAWKLSQYDHKMLRKLFSVNVERASRELAGEVCLHMHQAPELKQEIMKSCMFGRRVFDLALLREAAANYTSVAAEKMRKQQSLCQQISISVQTGMHEDPLKRYFNQIDLHLVNPTDDTRLLITAALAGLDRIYRKGYAYSKCAVRLTRLHQRGEFTSDLFAPPEPPGAARMGKVMDTINQRYGRQAIHSARMKPDPEWAMRRELLSPAYTTSWNDLPGCY
jgi:DNA polymerase V